MTVLVIAAVGVTASGAFQGPNSGSVNAGSDGTFAIDPRDLAYALGAGCVPVRRQSHSFAPMGALRQPPRLAASSPRWR